MQIQQIVFVTTHEHRHGRDVYVWATAHRAELERQRIASDYWEDELAGAEIPDDPREAANAYFDLVDGEFFSVDECEVQS